MKTLCIVTAWLMLVLEVIASVPSTGRQESTKLPIVDLAHERHQAISYNSQSGTYNFSNIRYAQPPTGDLRFRAAVPVRHTFGRTPDVNNGSVGAICPQPWTLFNDTGVLQWIMGHIQGENINLTEAQQQSENQSDPPLDPRTSEDCLFLDVIVPKKVVDQRGTRADAPVLVWIYGGGYLVGEKTGAGLYDPAGLLQASEKLGDDGFVFVAINYRLGALGFLSGPTMEAEGTPNAGLYDQRLALEWVRDNIHLFGGSQKRIAIMGESAGGGSVLHQLTAFGGRHGRAPFQQIITQSAGFNPAGSKQAREDVLRTFFAVANVSSLAELRELPSDRLVAANNIITRQLYQGAFHPAVDGFFIPEENSRMLLSGKFDYVRGLIGTNVNEGVLFGDPRINTSTDYAAYIRTVVPGITDQSAAFIQEELYPPIFDGSQGYTDNFERAYTTFQEFAFTCNQPFTAKGLKNSTSNYLFSILPGIHSQDLGFTFYNNALTDPSGVLFPPSSPSDVAAARVLQSWIASFVAHGKPSAAGLLPFDPYGLQGNVLALHGRDNSTYVTREIDPVILYGRCNWLAKAIQDQKLVNMD